MIDGNAARSCTKTTSAPSPRSQEAVLTITDLRVGYGRQARRSRSSTASRCRSARARSTASSASRARASRRRRSRCSACFPRGGHVTGGTIDYEGTLLDDTDERTYARIRGRRIGYIPQEPMSNLDQSFTIGSQLIEPLRVGLGMSKKDATEKALALLDRVGIPNPKRTFDAYPFEVSGGMAQRVLIAGAVSTDPDLIIADEPTTALDVTVQAEVLDLLRDLQAERHMAMLLVTHNFGVVADLCDRVTVMQAGRFVESGPARTILTKPHHPYTQSLLDAILEEGPARPPLATCRPRRGIMTEFLLDIDDLVVEYPGKGFRAKPFRALKGVSLDIRPGETVGLVGESGSGKTTLGRAVLGLAPVTEGKVVYDGKDISHLHRKERRALSSEIQVVFQDPYSSLNPNLTIEQILAEPLTASGVASRRRRPACASCSTRWACPPMPAAACRASSPAASGSASRSPAPSPSTRSSSCATSRSRRSTCRPRRACSTSSSRSRSAPASRTSSSRTTSRSCATSATASR